MLFQRQSRRVIKGAFPEMNDLELPAEARYERLEILLFQPRHAYMSRFRVIRDTVKPYDSRYAFLLLSRGMETVTLAVCP